MSNLAQTITVIGTMLVLIATVVGIQTFWISRSISKVEDGLAKVNKTLDEMKTEIVRDHGERIAKLEERIIRAR
jgi:hypothetical protein